MRIINFGSLNIDKVYQVEQFVRPGQTITAKDYAVAAGGKGLNQSLAAARAGAEVLHAGAIGAEGRFMADLLRESGADTSLLREVDGPSGHAVIEIKRRRSKPDYRVRRRKPQHDERVYRAGARQRAAGRLGAAAK